MAAIPTMIAVDVRPLQDPRARGVSHYAGPLLQELLRVSPDEFTLFASGTRPAPHFSAKTVKVNAPNKIINAGMRLVGTPIIDGMTGCRTVWMPNLNFWSVGPTARLVVTVHDLSFLVEPTWYSPRERLWHRAINARGLLRRANAIITLSKHTKQELVDILDIDEGKIHVIPPGVPNHVVAPSHSRLAPTFVGSKSFDGASDTLRHPYILCIGALERRKNVTGAIAAFERAAENMPEMHFIIAGAAGAGNEEISSKVKSSRYNGRIHLVGPVSAEEKESLMKGATAFFFPSLYEGFGFPPLEAMAAGVPVVASSAGALPETLGNAAIMLDPLDTGALAQALVAACTDAKLRETLIARGLTRVKQFSWERCAEETLRILNNEVRITNNES